MSIYSSFDYLCNEPFALTGIGHVKCPTLRDIRRCTYRIFSLYLNILSMSPEDYRKLLGPEQPIPEAVTIQGGAVSTYFFLLYSNPKLLAGLLSFFLTEEAAFDDTSQTFLVYEAASSGERSVTGRIGADNFEAFRKEVLEILGIRQASTRDAKCKNQKAKELLEKIEKAKKSIAREVKQDSAFTLDNMVKKYCTHNKVGINILNVWDLSFYQFQEMFREYQFARQADYHDSLAANTFSYKEVSDYKPMLWLEQINPT